MCVSFAAPKVFKHWHPSTYLYRSDVLPVLKCLYQCIDTELRTKVICGEDGYGLALITLSLRSSVFQSSWPWVYPSAATRNFGQDGLAVDCTTCEYMVGGAVLPKTSHFVVAC